MIRLSAGIFLGFATLASAVHAQTITFADTGDGTERPTLIEGLTVNATVYDVTITYENDGFGNPLPAGDIPIDDMDLASEVIRDALNALNPDNANTTLIVLQPSVPTITFTFPGNFQSNAKIFDASAAEDSWSNGISDEEFSGVLNNNATFGFAQFSASSAAVPEPSTLGLAAALSLVGVIWRRRRRQKSDI